MGTALKVQGIHIPEVWHSGKTRAQQTADLLGGYLAERGSVSEKPGLAPNDDVHEMSAQLADRAEDLMIVGHLPFLSRLASLLLVNDPETEIVGFSNAGVVSLDRDTGGIWRIQWFVVV